MIDVNKEGGVMERCKQEERRRAMKSLRMMEGKNRDED